MSRSSLGSDSIALEAVTQLRGVIGFDRWCLPFADPQSLLPGVGIADHDYGPALARSLELEFGGVDVTAKDVVARRPRPVGSLSMDTHGDLARSQRWDEVLRPVGIGDTAVAACRDDYGCWGWVEAHRDSSDRMFDDDDLTFLSDVAPTLGTVLRHALAATFAARASDARPAGTVVLDRELRAVSHTAPASEWMDLLPAAQMFAGWGVLPAPLYPVAALAREGRYQRAGMLVGATDGTWIRVEAAPLTGGSGEIAVTLRAAAPAETLDLLCRAHGLTRRERQLVGLLPGGLDTAALARRLAISPYTVQDHLKSVFAKLHVTSRRELVARLSGEAAHE